MISGAVIALVCFALGVGVDRLIISGAPTLTVNNLICFIAGGLVVMALNTNILSAARGGYGRGRR